jgi:hypothetical protein
MQTERHGVNEKQGIEKKPGRLQCTGVVGTGRLPFHKNSHDLLLSNPA